MALVGTPINASTEQLAYPKDTAVVLSGSADSYIDFGDPGSVFNGKFTVLVSAKLNTVGNPIIATGGCDFRYDSGVLQCTIFGASGGSIGRKSAAISLSTGVFYQFACTYSANGKASGIKIYLNGQRVDSADISAKGATIVGISVDDLWVGKEMAGSVDAIYVWTTAKTSTALKKAYNNPMLLYDSFNLIPVNLRPGLFFASDTPLTFNGSNVVDLVVLNGVFTVFARFVPEGTEFSLFRKTSSWSIYHLSHPTAGREVFFELASGAAANSAIPNSKQIKSHEEYALGVSHDGSSVRFYLDGNAVGVGSIGEPPSNGNAIQLGHDGVVSSAADFPVGFNGEVNSVYVWSRILSRREHILLGKTGMTP